MQAIFKADLTVFLSNAALPRDSSLVATSILRFVEKTMPFKMESLSVT